MLRLIIRVVDWISSMGFFRIHRTYRVIRGRIRGYLKLKKTNDIGLLRRIQTDLTDCTFIEVDRYVSKHIFGISYSKAELVVRQLLLQRWAGLTLNNELLYSLGSNRSVIFPLPKRWRKILNKHGFQIDHIKSSIAWIGLITLYLCYGILSIVRLAATSFGAALLHRPVLQERYAYFEGLTTGNLPQPGADGCSHDVITWYTRWGDRARDLCCLCHGVRDAGLTLANGITVKYIEFPYQFLHSFSQVIHFLFWGAKSIAISAFEALMGRWWHALVLAEAAKAKAVHLSDTNALATDYLFYYAGKIYRPMWTYEAEEKGARILCYFYSTYEQVKLPGGYEPQRYVWGPASWPIYLVWDRYQADLLRRDIDKNVSIKIVGPIWFSTSSYDLADFPFKSIAVFDIQPHRKSAYFQFSTMADYRTNYPNLNGQFLCDIHNVFQEFGITMIFKSKREIGNKVEKKNQKIIQKLSKSNDVIIINPNISAIKVIEHCKGTISMPFTSTALYLRDLSIPSVYYDPTGWIQKDDRGAHGIPILSGIEELRDWVVCVFTDVA